MPNDFISLEKYIDSQIEAIWKALETASLLMEKRLDTMNAFREQLNRAEGSFVTRKELDADKSKTITLWIAIIGLAISILVLLVNISK